MIQIRYLLSKSSSFIIGSGLLFFILFQHVLPSCLMFFGITISKIYFPLALVVSIGYLYWFTYQSNKEERYISIFIIHLISFLGLVLVSILIVSQYIDSSFDGMMYQQTGAIYLSEGWNSVKESLRNEDIINHYAQGSWMVWGSAYSFLGKIGLSKYVSFTLIFSTFFIVLSALKSVGSKKLLTNIPIAVILAFNPVCIYQSASFYLDGIVSSILTILLSLFVLHYQKQRNIIIYLLIILSLSFLANLKFTGVGFAIVLTGGFVFLYLITKEYKQVISLLLVSIISLILGIGVSGYHPYVKNTRDFGHPFYPLNEKDLMENHAAANFKVNNRFENLFISIFSRSEGWISPKTKTQWKIPFDTTDQPAFMGNDPRVGGFGSLFSAILLVSAILVILLLKQSRRKHWVVYYSLFVIFLSVIIVSAAWWARYVPQFFIIPAAITFLALVAENRTKLTRILGIVSIFLFAANAIMIANAHYSNINRVTEKVKDQMKLIGDRPIQVDFTCFKSMEKRFLEACIQFENVGLRSSESIKIAGGQNMAKFRFHDTLFTSVPVFNDSLLKRSDELRAFTRTFDELLFGESIEIQALVNPNVAFGMEITENKQHIKTLEQQIRSGENEFVEYQRVFMADRDYSNVTIKFISSGNDTVVVKNMYITVNKFKDSNFDNI